MKAYIAAIALSVGLAAAAQANLILTPDSPFKPSDESPATLESEIGARLGNPNLIDALQVNGQKNGTTFDNGVFQVSFSGSGTGQTATISYDLTGFDLSGVAVVVFGGNRGGNLYTITGDQAIIGFGTVNAPLVGNSGRFARISHLDFFVQPGTGNNVPESGSSAMLLGSALAGLAALRRFTGR